MSGTCPTGKHHVLAGFLFWSEPKANYTKWPINRPHCVYGTHCSTEGGSPVSNRLRRNGLSFNLPLFLPDNRQGTFFKTRVLLAWPGWEPRARLWKAAVQSPPDEIPKMHIRATGWACCPSLLCVSLFDTYTPLLIFNIKIGPGIPTRSVLVNHVPHISQCLVGDMSTRQRTWGQHPHSIAQLLTYCDMLPFT